MSDRQNVVSFLHNTLDTKFVGRHVHHYACLASTMEVAKKVAGQGAVEGTVVIADEQTSGRGRQGRAWLSPKGSLAISIILRPSLNSLPQLVMIASLAVVRAVRKVAGLEAQIKWPNDVLIKGKKVCGILIESEVKGDRVNAAIIGIGININLDPSAFPEISTLATSLSHELGKEIPRDKLTGILLCELEQLYLEAQAGAPVHEEWRAHMETLGKSIQVRTGQSVEQGIAEAVTKNGNLILRRADGSFAEILAGDVTVVKD